MPITAAELRRVPLTTGLCGACVLLTALYWGGRDLEFLFGDPRRVGAEPWRLVTSMLFHGSAIHLLFNLFWLWDLGQVLELWLGRARLLALVVVSAFASSAWELAVFEGGIGASGVVYALYSFAWVLRERPGLLGLVSRERTHLMIGWFFFCIVTTALGAWRVANVAHGVGALTGLLVGASVRWRGASRVGAVLGLICTVAAGYLGASALRPLVNLAERRGKQEASVMHESLVGGRMILPFRARSEARFAFSVLDVQLAVDGDGGCAARRGGGSSPDLPPVGPPSGAPGRAVA